MKALIVSSDQEETRLLSLIADWIGFDVFSAARLEEAMAQEMLTLSNLIALSTDNGRGLIEVRKIRAETLAPLLVMASGMTDELHAAVLDAGADLGVGRPYQPRLLASQMRALARRGIPVSPAPFPLPEEIEVDRSLRTARIGNGPAHQLSPLEFRLLEVLLAQRGQPVPTEAIIVQVWNYGPEESTDLVRKLVNRLRTKIEPDPSNPEYVINVPGAGYTLRESGVEWHLNQG